MSGRSYFDCVNIYPQDEQSISEDGALVRTSVVAFMTEFWNRKLASLVSGTNHESGASPSSEERRAGCLFLDPSVVQAMVGFGDATIGPIDDMRSASIIVLPVTTHLGHGAANSDGGDGGHWSLVVAVSTSVTTGGEGVHQRSPPVFYCIDSSGRYNEAASRRVVQLLVSASRDLGWAEVTPADLGGATLRRQQRGGGDGATLRYVAAFPQQETPYDCGVMLCLALMRIGECFTTAAAQRNEECAIEAVVGLLERAPRALWLWGGGGSSAVTEVTTVKLRARQLRQDILQLLNTTPFVITTA